MRLTPAQIGVHLICGKQLGMSAQRPIRVRIREGREFLAKITGKDFGYDLPAWHEHLKFTREGGYGHAESCYRGL